MNVIPWVLKYWSQLLTLPTGDTSNALEVMMEAVDAFGNQIMTGNGQNTEIW